MAVSNNILLTSVTGTINKQLVLRRGQNKTIISAYPNMSKRKLTPKQKNIHELMKLANIEIHAILKNEEQRKAAQIRLNVESNKLYKAMIREYFHNALRKNK